MKKGIYLISFDDILVDTSKLMYSKIRENWRIFSQYFSDIGDLTYQQIQERQLFDLSEWLIQKRYINLTSGQYSALQIIINKLLIDLCSNEIYNNVKPSLFAENSVMKPLFINSSFIDKVYIIVKYKSKIELEAKKAFIKKYFTSNNIEIIELFIGDSLGKYLVDNDIDFDAFVFNEINDLRDVIESNQNLSEKEFIRPNYGYNKIPQELQYLLDIRENTVTELNQFLKK